MEATRRASPSVKDLTLGFFGWWLYANFMAGVMMFEISPIPDPWGAILGYSLLACTWLPIVAWLVVPALRQRLWVGLGAAAAGLLNASLWVWMIVAQNAPASFFSVLWPLPAGLLLLVD